MDGMHLAELNIGRLVAETDDPRVAEFMGALDRVNGLGKRMPGFVWMMEGSGEPGRGNTDVKIGGDARFVSNLTVWESVETLESFGRKHGLAAPFCLLRTIITRFPTTL